MIEYKVLYKKQKQYPLQQLKRKRQITKQNIIVTDSCATKLRDTTKVDYCSTSLKSKNKSRLYFIIRSSMLPAESPTNKKDNNTTIAAALKNQKNLNTQLQGKIT